MAAEMVIRLVDGTSDTSQSLSPANQLPTVHNPDVPTVSSTQEHRRRQYLATVETDPKRNSDSPPIQQQEPTGKAQSSLVVESMQEFTERLETAIQDWARQIAKAKKETTNEQQGGKQRSTTERIVDAIEQRLPKRAQSAFRRVRRSKVWQNPTVRRMASRAKSSIAGIARKVGSSKFAKRLAASKLGQAVKSRGGAWVARSATALGLRGAASGAASAGATGAAGAAGAASGAGAGAGGAAAGAGGAAVAGVAAAAIPVAVTVGAFVALACAARMLNERFTATADTLVEFNGSIASQRSRRQATTTVNMLERSQLVGQSLARNEAATNRVQNSLEKIATNWDVFLSKFDGLTILGKNFQTLAIDNMNLLLASLNHIGSKITVWDPEDDKKTQKILEDALVAQNKSIANLFNFDGDRKQGEQFDEQLKLFFQRHAPDPTKKPLPPVQGGNP